MPELSALVAAVQEWATARNAVLTAQKRLNPIQYERLAKPETVLYKLAHDQQNSG